MLYLVGAIVVVLLFLSAILVSITVVAVQNQTALEEMIRQLARIARALEG